MPVHGRKIPATTPFCGSRPCYLDAPWELLATKSVHLAEKMSVKFCPVRRIGRARSPEPPSPYRLNIVFMAASPREYDNLNFEDEEVALLTATQHMGLDFSCEESGTLPLLAKRVADEHPDVVHLTCHGALHPKPILLLEDDFGGRADATPADLLGALPQPLPRLLFFSACETAQADASLIPLTKHLLYAGAPAALGWAAPVLDREATQLAAELYRRLAAGETLPTALAGARFALLTSEQREVLRTSTLFELPVPQPVMEALIEQTLPNADITTSQTIRHRLTALALWDTYEDLHDFRTDAYALHPLLRPRVGTLTTEEKRRLATALTLPLFHAWGGESGIRPDLMDSEIARFALLAEQAEPLASIAVYHLRHLDEHFEYRRAAQDGVTAIRLLDAASIPPSLPLLRLAIEACQRIGDVMNARLLRTRALQIIEETRRNATSSDRRDHAALLNTHARALVQEGQIDKALTLHREELAVYEQLGDLDGIANALWSIGMIQLQREEFAEAAESLQRSYAILTHIGRLDGICMVGIYWGQRSL